jgi:hypothetical protein
MFNREPAAWVGIITAVLAFLVSLNVSFLTAEQASLIVAAIVAVGGAVIAWRTTPRTPGAFTGVVAALAALATGYGLHVRPGVVGAVSGLILALLALDTRGQVSPVTSRATLGNRQA